MAAAGDPILASDINTRVGTATPVTADGTATSGTTESLAGISVTANLVSGRRYRVTLRMNVRASVAADVYFARIRQDNVSGTQIDQWQTYCNSTSSVGFPSQPTGEYTASATAAKTFVATLTRVAGTGTGQLAAAADRPATMVVDLINEP